MATQDTDGVEGDVEETEEDTDTHDKKPSKKPVRKAIGDVVHFAKENKKVLGIVLLIALLLIPLYYSIYFRLMPESLPITDEWARDSVENFYKQQITNDVNQKYAYLPAANRQELVDQQYALFLVEKKDTIDSQVKEISQNFKSQLQDENNNTYLLEIDPYMHYRYVLNYLENGYVGNVLINGKPYNTHRYGQIPSLENPRFHPWLIAKIYAIMHVFWPDMSVMRSMFFFPVIFCTLGVIPAFFIGRKFGGNLGGLIASVIIAIHPSILGRTVAGFSDTDSYNVFIPLFVIWFMFEMLDSESKLKTVVLGGLSGFLIGLYSIAWSGWWYLFDFIIVFTAGMCVFYLVKHYIEYRKGQVKHIFQKDLKKYLFVGVTIFVSSFIFVFLLGLLFSKTNTIGSLNFFFQRAFLEPFNFIRYKEVAITSIWPNVNTTVAELNLISLSKVISYMGVIAWGYLLFMAATVGLVLLMIRKQLAKIDRWFIGIAIAYYALLVKFQSSITNDAIWFGVLLCLPVLGAAIIILFFDSELKIEYSLFFTIFLVATMFASTRGVRFIALAVLVYGILLGASLGRMHKYFTHFASHSLKINKIVTSVVLFILICVLVLPGQISSARKQSINELPMVTDAWHDQLEIVMDNSTKAITSSWWDWGHWFVALSNRSVTFDGGSQGTRIEPIGKTLLTDNEDEAIDILRMLNCGEEESAKLLENHIGDQYESVKLLFRIIAQDKTDAKSTLIKNGLTENQADKVLNYTHCQPIDQYYVASNDMIGKAGVWGHFGGWNFTRATMFNRVKKATPAEGMRVLTQEFNLSQKDADKMYSQIMASDGDQFVTEWPSYAADSSASCQLTNVTISCQNGFIFNLSSEDAKIMIRDQNTGKAMAKKPFSVAFIGLDGKFKVKTYTGDIASISVAVFPQNGAIKSIMMDPKLAGAMFTRLYFFQGFGLEHFKLMSYKKDLLGQDSYLYRVIWNPTNTTITNTTSQ